MIGKHPLYIVMCVLEELIIFKFLVQAFEVHLSSDFEFVFVEHVVGEYISERVL